MRFLHHAILAGTTLLVGESLAATAVAQPGAASAYARQRAAAQGGGDRGYRPPTRPPFVDGGYGYHRNARFGYYPYQPAIAGSWYTRPHPHHFDYYRWRYAAPQPANDCPCAETTRE